MMQCSLCKKLHIVPGCLHDYHGLAHYHYRDSKPGPYTAIFTLRPAGISAKSLGVKLVGVIVYATPKPHLELRSIATGNLFTGLPRRTQLQLVNKNIRCISRVIIEPRFRGLGLASRLVRETMPQMNVPIIEALAVMGLVNPFFEKAGMTAYTAPTPARCMQLAEALSMVGIEQKDLIDAKKVQRKLDALQGEQAAFIERQIRCFLQNYGRSRDMPAGLARTRYILSKLTYRPVYYIWFNPNMTNHEKSNAIHRSG
jgi:hypothetical protein